MLHPGLVHRGQHYSNPLNESDQKLDHLCLFGADVKLSVDVRFSLPIVLSVLFLLFSSLAFTGRSGGWLVGCCPCPCPCCCCCCYSYCYLAGCVASRACCSGIIIIVWLAQKGHCLSSGFGVFILVGAASGCGGGAAATACGSRGFGGGGGGGRAGAGAVAVFVISII